MTARTDGKHIASYEGNALHLPCFPVDCARSGASTGRATAGKKPHHQYILRKTLYPSIAQLEERETVMVAFHLKVAGSIPARRI